jgi:hypothetical protein
VKQKKTLIHKWFAGAVIDIDGAGDWCLVDAMFGELFEWHDVNARRLEQLANLGAT